MSLPEPSTPPADPAHAGRAGDSRPAPRPLWKRVKKLGTRAIRRGFDWMGRQSLVGDAPVLDADWFPFTALLEKEWRSIRRELDAVLASRRPIPAFHEVSPDQYKISYGAHWRTFVLFGFGARHRENCARCPETVRILEQIPGLQSAFFSILAPGFHIREHRGLSKGLVRVHLALKVPKAAERCRLRVDDQYLTWQEGRVVVFDDTYRHEVWNETDEERVVLFLDVDRPMRWPGRAVHKTMLAAIRQTAYFKDPVRNLDAWEERLRMEDEGE